MATRSISGLADSFSGELLAPGDAGYDEARQVWNGAIDRRPGLIARCAGVADVVAALRHAREHELLVAVRGGGHGVAGLAVCDDGIVIDLAPMRGIAVDSAARTARAQAGVLWGELDAATQAAGLATVGGIVTHTGIAGLTLGGGIGWLMRRYGATVDNLLSAEVVTADGAVLRASADEHPELFWGLRGGGGNFGIVTSFEYRLHPVGPTVLAGPILYALEDGPEVLRFYRDYIAEAPDELTTIVMLRRAPALPFVPAELHGRPVVMVVACYAGPVERGEEVLAPLRRFGRPLVDAIAPRPYVELQAMFNPGVPHGWHYYWKSWELPPLQDAAIDTLVEQAHRITSPRSYVIVFQLGGALARVGEHDTAFGQRDAAHDVNINAVWLPDDPARDEHVRWARECYAALEPFATGRTYVNFLADEGQQRVRAAYGEERYGRLVALKRAHDPENVFRLNQNIDPRGLDLHSAA
jgi:FAD binding domain-containing protein/berberine-like enzyme